MNARSFLIALVAAIYYSSSIQAAFIVEPRAGGKANNHFTYQDGSATSNSTASSTAAGLTAAIGSVFGGNGPTVDRYIFSYTPGPDVDNTVYTTGQVLGDTRIDPPGNPSGVSAEAQLATGAVGGASGTYKVYITWPGSGNVDTSGSVVTVTSDGSPIVLDPVDQNSATTNGPTPSGSGGANKWLLIGTVKLTANNTYTVTQQGKSIAFVSQRNAGVMWELQPEAVPEPSTMLLLSLAGLGLVNCRRCRG